jgi:glucose-6-phosphate 1-dehydrogenase
VKNAELSPSIGQRPAESRPGVDGVSGEAGLSVVVLGASGDLARRKILPALFSLYCQDLLPRRFTVYGFARTPMDDGAFRNLVAGHLTCRYTPAASCADRMAEFLDRCHYVSGQYGDPGAMLDLFERMRATGGYPANLLFYLAVPPSVFLDVSRAIGAAGFVRCAAEDPWSRVVIEKPFGHDRASSDALTSELAAVFTEDQTFRIDHYLGKEIVQNLMVLRFANLIFEPLWNRRHVERVWIDWREDLSLEGRAGYFDGYGIIRDVMQNHLVQILALTAMERPRRAAAREVRDEKVRVLRCVPPVTPERLVVGQYTAAAWNGVARRGYREEPGVPPGSRTPTFAAAALGIDNDRWRGVPFIMRAGKGLNARESEVRIQFRNVPDNIFGQGGRALPSNELVIRIQPDEGVYLGVVNKVPGLDMTLEKTELNLRYQVAFQRTIPDAYECLLLDVIQGDKSLFIRADELEAAWDIFTPALHRLERDGVEPAPYPFGSTGPDIGRILA